MSVVIAFAALVVVFGVGWAIGFDEGAEPFVLKHDEEEDE